MRILRDSSDWVAFDKPHGLLSHHDGSKAMDALSLAEQQLGRKLWLCHRLDRETSGVLLFAKSRQAAEKLRAIFAARQIKKTYRLLTLNSEKSALPDQLECGSTIQDKKTKTEQQSLTYFKRVKRTPFFECWQATPITGRTHQIRVHAAQMGLPILGDSLYGGADFPRLCLHAEALNLPEVEPILSRPPIFFDRLGYLKWQPWCSILSDLDARLRGLGELNLHGSNQLSDSPPTQRANQPSGWPLHYACFRIFYCDNFSVDWLGDRLWVTWRITPRSHQENLEKEFLPLWQKLAHYLRVPLKIEVQPLISSATPKFQISNALEGALMGATTEHLSPQWEVYENGYRFELRQEVGQHYGLFLDHRPLRKFLTQNARGKKVLNLFCYTGSLGVASATGGCRALDQVDLSKKYLDWAKRNLEINGFSEKIISGEFKFFHRDSLDFLTWSKKKLLSWDIILLDPPTFSRSRGKSRTSPVFRVKKEGIWAIKRAWELLSPGGLLVFSTHDQSWTLAKILAELKQVCQGYQKIEIGPGTFDFKNDRTASKSILITKPSL